MIKGAWGTAWLVAALAIGFAISWAGLQPPPVRGANAPADAFSAARAMVDVRAIAVRPHPTGSAEAARVRGYITQRMQALGLQTQVREGVGASTSKWAKGRFLAAARVENLIGVLPGRERTLPALAIMAHSDSVANSPGGSDDSAGVAAGLEILRAIKARGQPERDVWLVITDAEEAGLLGAEAFFATDPLSRRVGAVINMDTRGGGGRAFMFQVTPGDQGWIALLAAHAPHASANSLAEFIARLMPNDTDFSIAHAHGVPGLNFAFVGDFFDYHTAHATAAALDPRSLQHMGEQALGAAQALAASRTLPAKGPDVATADPPLLPLLHYDPVWGWVLIAAGGGALALLAARGAAAGWFEGGGLWRGPLAALASLLATATALGAAGALLNPTYPQGLYGLLQHYGALQAGIAALCVGAPWLFAGLRGPAARIGAATALVALALIAGFLHGVQLPALGLGLLAAALAWVALARPPSPGAAWVGSLAWLLIVAIALQLAAPVGAFAAEWPLGLAALGAVAAVLLGVDSDKGGTGAALAITAGLTLGFVAFLGGTLLLTVGLMSPAAMVVPVLLALPAFAPLVWRSGREWAGLEAAVGAIVLGAGLLAFAGLATGGSPRAPALSEVFYVSEPAAGAAWRVDALDRLDDWSRPVLAAGGPITHKPLAPLFSGEVYQAPAPVAALPAPQLILQPERASLRILAQPSGEARQLRLWLRSAGPVGGVKVQGRATGLQLKPGRWSQISFDAPPPGGIAVEVAGAGAGGPKLELVLAQIRDGFPPEADPHRPMPPHLMPWGLSGTTWTVTRGQAGG